MFKHKLNIPKLLEIPKSDITEKVLYENAEFIFLDNEEIFKAIENLPFGRNKNGDGRKAEQIAKQFHISASTVYQAMKILKEASSETLYEARTGRISIKEAYKIISKNIFKHSFSNEKNNLNEISDCIMWAHIKISTLSYLLKEEKQLDLLDDVKGYLIDAENKLVRIMYTNL